MVNSSQRGYVLLALLLVIFVTGSSVLLGSLNNRQQIANARQSETIYQLMKAKEALLAFAANSATIYGDSLTPRGPGFFPCPDSDNNGIAEQNCNANQPIVGRLPDYVDIEMPLPLPDERYSLCVEQPDPNSRLWYVVAPRHVYHSSNANFRRSRNRTSALATESNLRMTLDGTGNFVALVIASGDALIGQDRITSPNNFSSFLELRDPTDPFAFVSNSSAGPEIYNDIVVGITHDEYMQHIGPYVGSTVRNRLTTYQAMNMSYPEGEFAPPFNDNLVDDTIVDPLGDDWMSTEGWKENSPPNPGAFCSFFPFLPFCAAYIASLADKVVMERMYFEDIAADTFSLQFYGCDGMSFTISTSTGHERSGTSCQP